MDTSSVSRLLGAPEPMALSDGRTGVPGRPLPGGGTASGRGRSGVSQGSSWGRSQGHCVRGVCSVVCAPSAPSLPLALQHTSLPSGSAPSEPPLNVQSEPSKPFYSRKTVLPGKDLVVTVGGNAVVFRYFAFVFPKRIFKTIYAFTNYWF